MIFDQLNKSVNDHSLNIFGECLSGFIERSNFDMSLKDAQKNTYIQTSSSMAKDLGVPSSHDLVGLSIREVLKKFYPCKQHPAKLWKSKEPSKIDRQEYQVKDTRSIISRRHLFFTTEGKILVLNTTKIPLGSCKSKRTAAIPTLDQNLTFQNSLPEIFRFYQYFYPKKQAVRQILKHLKLDCYFNPLDFPTGKEMQVLFAMRCDSSAKHVARFLNLSAATVANHISALQNKLLERHSLHNVLVALRELPLGRHRYERVSAL